ncbi:hypothetical protein [Tritonibacter mobilis]|jgi:hypothetical protein|uniref:hypothetical protein n=1 Tax=Tritonibacter mobilis TaxID=379347 RepID=UPI00089CCC49|nr:hypothetical protein [Tritonibacter mobilis]SDX99408.1 hypothetical protein SAMN05444385_12022 [Tritonibacter mobilis]
MLSPSINQLLRNNGLQLVTVGLLIFAMLLSGVGHVEAVGDRHTQKPSIETHLLEYFEHSSLNFASPEQWHCSVGAGCYVAITTNHSNPAYFLQSEGIRVTTARYSIPKKPIFDLFRPPRERRT